MTVAKPARRLLLIDDDPDELFILTEAAGKISEDIDIRLLSDHHQLAQVCAEFSPELIFLDLNMPVFTGLDWLALMKRKSIEVPVVMYSTGNNPERVNQSYLEGAALYLTKPVDFSSLVISLKEILLMDWKSPGTVKSRYFIDGRYRPFILSN